MTLDVYKNSEYFEHIGMKRIAYHKWLDSYKFNVMCLRCRKRMKGESMTLKSSKYKARRTIICKCEVSR